MRDELDEKLVDEEDEDKEVEKVPLKRNKKCNPSRTSKKKKRTHKEVEGDWP